MKFKTIEALLNLTDEITQHYELPQTLRDAARDVTAALLVEDVSVTPAPLTEMELAMGNKPPEENKAQAYSQTIAEQTDKIADLVTVLKRQNSFHSQLYTHMVWGDPKKSQRVFNEMRDELITALEKYL